MSYFTKLLLKFVVVVFFLSLSSCNTTYRHQEKQHVTPDDKNRKHITFGMTQEQVHALLGQPQIATKDMRGKEAWIYDHIASDIGFDPQNEGIWELEISEKEKKAQNVLTIVVKFSGKQTVEDVTYHSYLYDY